MTANDSNMPRSIDDYLLALRRALKGADVALIQDALNDAEAHLRAECAARPNETEELVLLDIAGSYGMPEDVAAAYLESDRAVQQALTPARTSDSASSGGSSLFLRRFFAVYGDVRSWTSLLWMLLSLFTGILYFVTAVTGISLSLGLMILIIGLPVFIAFIGLSRLLALVEGRLVEAMTGERMPRRAPAARPGGWLPRIAAMLRDVRTWTTLAYQLLSLPLGVIYFSLAITLTACGLGMLGAGALALLGSLGLDLPATQLHWAGENVPLSSWQAALLAFGFTSAGILVLTTLLHLARLLGRLQGRIAKRLLVAA